MKIVTLLNYKALIEIKEIYYKLLAKTDEYLETEYLAALKRNDYPFDKFPNVVFIFDSNQNVQENFEGSYFYRL